MVSSLPVFIYKKL